jgi:inosine-uridine nucleoside N-ribohydrolase
LIGYVGDDIQRTGIRIRETPVAVGAERSWEGKAMTTMKGVGLAVLIASSIVTPLVAEQVEPVKVIIDADPGIDDAMAILFALASPALDVVGITTGFGNATIENATENALTVVGLAGSSVPVARGAERPLERELPPPPTFVHGADGLGQAGRQHPVGTALEQTAAEFIVDMARRFPGEITLVPVGRLTNVALALEIEPRLPELIKEVVLMGGAARVEGNVSPVAEANIHGDPHAADIVFNTPWKVTMVGLDVTTQVRMTDDRLRRIAESNPRLGEFVWAITRFYKGFYESEGVEGGFYVHDPSAIAYVIQPELFQTETGRVRVASEGLAVGQTITTLGAPKEFWTPWLEAPDVSVCRGVDADALLNLYEKTVGR